MGNNKKAIVLSKEQKKIAAAYHIAHCRLALVFNCSKTSLTHNYDNLRI